MPKWAAPLLLMCAGCLDLGSQGSSIPITFKAPIRVSVEAGDTLSTIANAHGVSVADLMAWNALDTDAIEAGGVLFVWEVETTTQPQPSRFRKEQRVATNRRTIGKTPGRAPRPKSPARVRGGEAEPPIPPQQEGEEAAEGEAENLPEEMDDSRPRSVANSGIFGVDLGDASNDGLADAVAGLSEGSKHTAETDRVRGASMRPGAAEASADLDVRVKNLSSGPQIPNVPVRTPSMSKPAAKRCKPLKARSTGENGMWSGDGLSTSAIKSALARPLGISRRCLPPGTKGTYNMLVELKVGCDGRVKNVYTISNGGIPAAVTQCVEAVLSNTGFPAHDIPDGQSFQYPIRYSF